MKKQQLKFSQHQEALDAAQLRFAEICKKHPTLRADLVLSRKSGQIKVDDKLSDFIQDELKRLANTMSQDIKILGDIQVELRFHTLNYELIWKLQSDELVDRVLTPQTRASIRIVLGTISHFVQEPS